MMRAQGVFQRSNSNDFNNVFAVPNLTCNIAFPRSVGNVAGHGTINDNFGDTSVPARQTNDEFAHRHVTQIIALLVAHSPTVQRVPLLLPIAQLQLPRWLDGKAIPSGSEGEMSQDISRFDLVGQSKRPGAHHHLVLTNLGRGGKVNPTKRSVQPPRAWGGPDRF